MQNAGLGLYGEDITIIQLRKYLPAGEYELLSSFKNAAAQMIDKQSQELGRLRKDGLVNEFEHVHLQKILNDFYDQQGKAERIKKTPFPVSSAALGLLWFVCLSLCFHLVFILNLTRSVAINWYEVAEVT